MSVFKLSGTPCPPRQLLIQPSANSPFCTSPSQLQEVTLDPEATNNFSYFGMRSPGAINGGRSVKEIDEQLTNLRKENFNLKLRIYFLEERMGANFNTDKENAIKKNIELMVELENVRKELEDKQELLCQAAKAMEIEEDEKKKEIAIREEEINKLKIALTTSKSQLKTAIDFQDVNKELALCAEAFNLDLPTNDVQKLQDTIKELQDELTRERQRADHFESIMELAESAHVRCQTLENQAEDTEARLTSLTTELNDSENRIISYSKRVETLEEELNEKMVQLKSAHAEISEKDHDLKQYLTRIEQLTKICDTTQVQCDKYERKVDKYKGMLIQCENKNHEMMLYIESLKNKVQNLETRLASALDEVKKTNIKTETVLCTEQNLKSSNIDVALFSVRNPMPVSQISPKKILPKMNLLHPSLTSSFITPTTPSKPSPSMKSPTSNSSNRSDDLLLNGSEAKMGSISYADVSNSDAQFSTEEIMGLKKNHFKACKMIKAMLQRKNEYIEQISRLQAVVDEREYKIQNLEDKIIKLTESNNLAVCQKKKSIKELVSELNITAGSNPAANKETSMAGDGVHLAEQYKELANELESKIEILNSTLKEKDNQLEHLQIELQCKINRIVDLEFEIVSHRQELNDSFDTSYEKEEAVEKLMQDQQDKEKEIKRLDGELRKRTCDLQGIVNKELWEKNRAIEKLQTLLKIREEEVAGLEKNISGKDLQLKVLKDKINELGVHVNLSPSLMTVEPPDELCSDIVTVHEQLRTYLVERKHFIKQILELETKLRNTPEHDENRQLIQLQSEYKDLRQEMESLEQLRQEGQEICSVLSCRLEELCLFLKYLLKQKSVLGFLGSEQTQKLQLVINKSIDLSRTLSTSISLNPDQSLLQLSNITNLLNSTRNESLNINEFFYRDDKNNSSPILSIIASDVTLTYQSHLNRASVGNNEQAEVIHVLRRQVANLEREVAIRDVELEKKLTNSNFSKPLENDEEFIDALVDLQPQVSATACHETSLQSLREGFSKLNVTSSTLVADKSGPNTTSTTLRNINSEIQSESESWSEPDRTVSLARIGLRDESLKRPSSARINTRLKFTASSDLSTENEEELLSCGLNKTPSKRGSFTESRQTIISLHEQVCGMELQLKEKENQLLAAQVAFYEADNQLKQEQVKLEESNRTNLELSKQIMIVNTNVATLQEQKAATNERIKNEEEKHFRLIAQIDDINKKLDEVERQKCAAETKVSELQNIVSLLQAFKTNVEATMSIKNKEMQNTINEMEVEKEKALAAARKAQKLVEIANNEKVAAEIELEDVKVEAERVREVLERECNDRLREADEQCLLKIKTVEKNCEVEAQKCREAVVVIKESYEQDYVKKSQMDERLINLEAITNEVENLKHVIREFKAKIHAMEGCELELKNRMEDLQREHYDKISELHKELDNATLQYSEAILEKTRLKNEMTCLEQKVQQFYSKEAELIKDVKNLHAEFRETQTKLQTQVARLEHNKSALEMKISHLETANSDLQRSNSEMRLYLHKIQATKNFSAMASVSLPNNVGGLSGSQTSPINIPNVRFTSQISDNSGYTSEDIPVEESELKCYAQSHLQSLVGFGDIDHERMHENSSPDLGIESDHGRLSSLEVTVGVPRPLLPTLELTQSMSNLLGPIQDVNCGNDQCCKNTKLMANENVELRKRLLRTRRALEETLNRLTLANKQKKEVEKSICKQIHKTSQVLRRAKANLDSGSETDIVRK